MASRRAESASLRFLLLFLFLIFGLAIADDDDKKDKPSWKKKRFDNQLTPFMFFEDSEVILVTDPHDGVVYRSPDAGAKWDRVEEIPDEEAVQVFMPPASASKKHAVVLGRRNTHWITSDHGKSWREFKTQQPPSPGMPLSFHSGDPDKIILNTGIEWTREAVYTTSGFKKEDKKAPTLREKSVQCAWAKEKDQFDTGSKKTDEDRIICIVQGPRSPHIHAQRLIYSDNYFKDEQWPALEEGRQMAGIVSMVSTTRYMLAARRSDRTSELAMYSSLDGANWQRAFFGQQKLEADGFTIMESTNHSVQVDVLQTGAGIFRAPAMGKLYTSNSNGTRFSQSEEFTNRNDIGFVDYEALDVVEGVAITNIVDNAREVLERNDPKRVKSRITFDDGRSFQEVKTKHAGPLHLHSYTEIRNQGKVFSSKVPGLVMGVGNAGEVLQDYESSALYVSSDAGESWTHALQGGHKYEFGDSGAVLVAVEDEKPSKEIAYSFDFGRHWEKTDYEDKGEEVRPVLLTTVPDSTMKKFVMQATTGRGIDQKHWIYQFDFNGMKRKCDKKDFEEWQARIDKDGKQRCIMGRTQTFRRRKPDADCFVDEKFDEPQAEYHECDCTDADFECEYGFSKSGTKCEPTDPIKPEKGQCKSDDGTFKASSGYRKIPGNHCNKKKDEDYPDAPVQRPCSGRGDSNVPSGDITSKIHPFEFHGFTEYHYLERGDTSTSDDETIVMTDNARNLWVTRDHGKNWENLEIDDDVLAIYPNKNNHDHVYFVTPSKKVFYSTDRMDRVRNFDAPGPPNVAKLPAIRFHETQDNWLIWTTCEDFDSRVCDPKSYANQKEGSDKKWESLIESAGACEFVYRKDRPADRQRIFCEKKEKDRRSLVWSDDWFATKETPFEDIVTFATMSEFIIVASRDVGDRTNLFINSSIDARTFAPAHFPDGLHVPHHDGYTALDSSTHSIFLHATTNGKPDQEYGSIIKSNSNGTSFVMSLEHVNRNSDGYVDFEKLFGIEGAAVANIVDNHKEVLDGRGKKRKSKTTHNDGADWTLIQPPEKNRKGETYPCVEKKEGLEKCSLHLHGYTERKDPGDSFTSPTATGVVIGIGNVGDHLGELSDGNTFISTDGGVTWKTAMDSQYMWEFGDQGSIIVLVQGDKPTNKVVYSLDEGKSWTDYEFDDDDIDEIEVSDITTLPSDGSRNFLLWGTKVGHRKQAVTVNIDFSGVLEKRCKMPEDINNAKDVEDSDYYLWTPQHPTQQGQDKDCVFGHEAQILRKRAGHKCYNGFMPKREEISQIKRNCTCNTRDFECDYNYVRAVDNTCHPQIDESKLQNPRDQCAANPSLPTYRDLTGYRKIPLDTCTGGSENSLLGTLRDCPGHKGAADEENRRNGKSGTSKVGILFAIIFSVAAAGGIGWFVYTRYVRGSVGRIQLGEDSGDAGVGRAVGSAFRQDAPWIKYPIMGLSALVAGVMAVPMLIGGLWRRARGGSDRYYGYRSSGRPYTSRSSFARGRGQYAAVGASDESDLLGEDSEDEA